jgi:hypothetical protein
MVSSRCRSIAGLLVLACVFVGPGTAEYADKIEQQKYELAVCAACIDSQQTDARACDECVKFQDRRVLETMERAKEKK